MQKRIFSTKILNPPFKSLNKTNILFFGAVEMFPLITQLDITGNRKHHSADYSIKIILLRKNGKLRSKKFYRNSYFKFFDLELEFHSK